FVSSPDDPGEDLADARARWARADLTSYIWTVDRACFCAGFGAAEIRVEDGEKVSVERVDQGSIPPEEAEFWPTVDELFEIVERAIQEAGALEVDYDTATGAPLFVDIDWIANAIDDEVRYTATPPVAVD
ncbi:MAG: DUF6174 domain-containing protein, partial [Gemmatimonadota bacterium]